MGSRLFSRICFVVMFALIAPCGAQVDDPNLVGWWSFDEGTGTIVADGSFHGNDGTLINGPRWVAGVYGMALQFDGQDDYVGTGQSLLNDLVGFTMAGWVSAANTGVYSSLFGQNDLIEFGFTTENGGQLGTWMAGNDWAFVGADYDFAYPSWHHVVLTGDADRIAIYIDGEEVASDEGGMSSGTSGYEFNIGAAVFNTTGDPFEGEIDDVWLFNRALTREEILDVMNGAGDPEMASAPNPTDEATDVPRDVVLGWSAGVFAFAHDVYFGMTFADVNSADRGNPMDVLVTEGQGDTNCALDHILDFDQTYYWRVDEVNAAPDNTIFKGDVWSFTTEPFAYTIENVTVGSNGISAEGEGPENIVNGSGLDNQGQHSINAPDMWLASPNGDDPVQLRFEFDRVYKLYEMLVWNYNVQFELALGLGVKDVTAEYSVDGQNWSLLGDVEFAQATAKAGYTANTTIAFEGVPARYVRLTIKAGYGVMGQYGLSEVRFTTIPVQAREPQPTDGATAVDPGTALQWRSGREASAHEVYLGTDPDSLALVETTTEAVSTEIDLAFGKTYYWRIDEVNEADAVASWAGDIWTFSTTEFALLDGFENYDDEGNPIYETWIDGWVNNTGSTVGYLEAPFAEQTIVHSGRQSMPLQYDNTAAPFYSETERTLGTSDLAAHAADALRLFIAGQTPPFYETADGTILMSAIGTDIWDNADEFRYAYKSLSGDGSIIARVEALDGSSSGWAKAGVMIRQDRTAGSAHTMMILTGGDGNGASWQGRLTADAASENADAMSPVAPPYWVRIDRSANSFSGFISSDGETWTQVGTARTIAMDDPVLIGLALTSHNAGQATGAEFSHVGMTGGVTGMWQTAAIGAAQPSGGNLPAPVYLAVEDAGGGIAIVENPIATIASRSGWTEWVIPYNELTAVDLSAVEKMIVGVGDRNSPSVGTAGTIFIDDIGYGHPAAE